MSKSVSRVQEDDSVFKGTSSHIPLSERSPHVVYFDEPGLTVQADKEACDVNVLMSKYEPSMVLQHFSQYQGNYGDFSAVQDYHTSLNQITAANEMFMSLPATLRAQFDNDPGAFLEFVDDPKNLDRMIEMGLAKGKVVQPLNNSSEKKSPAEPDVKGSEGAKTA